MRWWPEPTAGEIVWCHFPDNIHPKPKPRPGLIVSTKEDDEGMIFVSVAYGTSQKTDRLYSGEFRIAKSEQPSAYTSAGLSYDTKFDLRNVLELPFNDAYFSVPPHAPYGQNPKLGTLHPSMVRIAATAFAAASSQKTSSLLIAPLGALFFSACLVPAVALAQPGALGPASVEVNAQKVPVYRWSPVDNARAPSTNPGPSEAGYTAPTSNLKTSSVQFAPQSMGRPALKADKTVGKTVQVKPGDTTSRLALQFLDPSVSLDQMMLAMLKANPDAFIQGNVNLVKAGAVLRIPEAQEAAQIPREQARQTVIAQSMAFAQYAARLAESTSTVGNENSRAMSGNLAPEGVKPEAPDAQQDKLTLSKPSAQASAAEEKIARSREIKDASAQTAALSKNLKDLEALAQQNPSASSSSTTDSAPSPSAAEPAAGVGTAGTAWGEGLKDLIGNTQLWAWAAAFLAVLFLVALAMRKTASKPDPVFAPSYDDAQSPVVGSVAAAVVEPGQVQVQIPEQMRSIDLSLSPEAADTFVPVQTTNPAPQPTQGATEQSKLSLAIQLMANGEKDLARSLLLSLMASSNEDTRSRAIQMLGEIRTSFDRVAR